MTDVLSDLHPSVVMAHLLDSKAVSTAISTYNGYGFDIFNPSTWIFDLDEIAQSLANTCRFGGHVDFYSVAEHSVRVSSWLEANGYDVKTQIIGLLHDAIEAYIGDIPRPIKKTFTLDGENIVDLEKSMEYALFASYGLLDDDFDEIWAAIKKADWAIYELERNERPVVGHGMLPSAAKHVFLQRFTFLEDLLD